MVSKIFLKSALTVGALAACLWMCKPLRIQEPAVVDATQTSMIGDIPHSLPQPNPEIEVVHYLEIEYATPGSAITEKAKGLAYIESQKPKMYYYATLELTAYAPSGNACKDESMPVAGWTAASNDPNLWHRTVYIDGVGTRYIHDTGAMSIGVIDIFMATEGECWQFGRRTADVYVYE